MIKFGLSKKWKRGRENYRLRNIPYKGFDIGWGIGKSAKKVCLAESLRIEERVVGD